MATSNDLLRLSAVLPDLARSVYQATADKFNTQGWIDTRLDVRYFREGGGRIAKVRVVLADGGSGSLRLPAETLQLLHNLDSVRQENSDLWFGLLIRVTNSGECDTKFDYDPACADDDAFIDI